MKWISPTLSLLALGTCLFLFLENRKLNRSNDDIAYRIDELEYLPSQIEDIEHAEKSKLAELAERTDALERKANSLSRTVENEVSDRLSEMEFDISGVEDRLNEIKPQQEPPISPEVLEIMERLRADRLERTRLKVGE